MTNEKLYINLNLCSVVTFAVVVRWSVSLHPYSGQSKPPMFGDYEAQRHWMEITLNLPLEEWYFNTSNNDLMYWGLDYPPLTAYHSYVNGKIGQYINSDFVALQKSKGYESNEHKFFMRATVMVADLIVYFVSITLFYNSIYKNNQNCVELRKGEVEESATLKVSNLKCVSTTVSYLAQIAIALLYPGIILIDHGHFQYNSISLGFTVLAVTSLVYNRFVFGAFYFCLALNYKQMSLYHSLPFFIYMLSKCLQLKKSNQFINGLQRLFSISLTVIVTFGILWFPFLTKKGVTLQVVNRLFPLTRGIFEDKVSNMWCFINVFYKLNHISDKVILAKTCIACVMLSSLPSLRNLFRFPTILRFILSLINVSLSFFLFSYQVHEKSILLVAIPVLLYFPFDPFPCFWFLLISNFSMLPLLIKDNLIIPFVALSILFMLFVFANTNFNLNFESKSTKNMKFLPGKINPDFLLPLLFKLSIIGCVTLTLCSVFITPPIRYPDLWPLMVSIFSFFHFFSFFVYFNYVQIAKTLD